MNEILKFVTPNYSSDAAVLVIESAKYLEALRKLMPSARIALLISDATPKTLTLCKTLKVDVLTGSLPIDSKIFDVVIAENALTVALDVYRTLLEINHLLKDSGFLLTQFLNVRFVGVLEALSRGEFSANEKRFWAKWDVVKILNDATYKEIRFLPAERADIAVNDWTDFGFDNFNDDLTTRIWLVKACKCTAEVAALKDMYTLETRAELSRLLHRIEYDIDVEQNLKALKELCGREKIFADYLNDFIEQVVMHESAAEFIKRATVDKMA